MEANPPALMVDNQPAITLVKNLVLHDRSKHIDVKFHFLRDCVDGGLIIIEFVETGRQLTDVLTKLLGRLHQAARTSLTHGAEGDDRHRGGTRVSSRIRGRLLDNLLLSCVNTAREGGAELAPCCDTVAAVGAGAARLTCSTVATYRGRHRVSPAVLSSYCCSMCVVLGLDR